MSRRKAPVKAGDWGWGQGGEGLVGYVGEGGAAFQTTERYLSGLLRRQLSLPLPLQLLQQLPLHDALRLLHAPQHLALDLILPLLQLLLHPLGHQFLHSPRRLLLDQLLLDLLLPAGGRGKGTDERREDG